MKSMEKVSRKIVWVSSLQTENESKISFLEEQLKNFYAKQTSYYSLIDFTGANWISSEEPCYQQIIKIAEKSNNILEFGCGSANILKYTNIDQGKYSGCDFSEELIQKNRKKYPQAKFKSLNGQNILPYEDECFDFLFSTYVLEHSTNPSKLLNECLRVLKTNGTLVIFCPAFLDCGRMSSQRAGFSVGTARDKFRDGKFFDALITYFDDHIRIPLYCWKYRKTIKRSQKFLINLHPTVFTDRFIPDVDAVYVTCKSEIISFLSAGAREVANSQVITKYEENRKAIFVEVIKV